MTGPSRERQAVRRLWLKGESFANAETGKFQGFPTRPGHGTEGSAEREVLWSFVSEADEEFRGIRIAQYSR